MTYTFQRNHAEPKNLLPSETIPDETMTIKQLLERHMRGQKMDETLQRKGYFADNEDFDAPDFEAEAKKDIYDQHEQKQKLEEEILLFKQSQKKPVAKADGKAAAAGDSGAAGKAKAPYNKDHAKSPTRNKERKEEERSDDDDEQPLGKGNRHDQK